MNERTRTGGSHETGKLKTYTVLYAVDVPHYGRWVIEAGNDADALAAAKAVDCEDVCSEPQWDSAVCKRIVHIEDPDGNTPHRDVPLDEFSLRSGGEADRVLCDAATDMLSALRRYEEAWRKWADDTRTFGKLAESCELFSIHEQARAAIRKATIPREEPQ